MNKLQTRKKHIRKGYKRSRLKKPFRYIPNVMLQLVLFSLLPVYIVSAIVGGISYGLKITIPDWLDSFTKWYY